MTKSQEIHFRCPDELRAAIDSASDKKGKDRTEKIVKALCKAFKVKYVPRPNGRPPKPPA